MEAVKDQPAEPSADDFSDDVHDTADDRHATRSHHPDGNDRVEAGAREGVNCDKGRDNCERIGRNVRQPHQHQSE